MTSNRIWILATALVVAGVLGLGWLLAISPLLTRGSEADAERSSVELTNQAQTALLAQAKTQYEDIEALRAELKVLRVSVPAEVDSDYVYALLSQYQDVTGAKVASITTGEAVLYGVSGEAPADGAETASASGPGLGGTLAEILYTVPVTVTFDEAPLANVLQFVKAMQTGPRLFLVTSVVSSGESGSVSVTVTAYMFIVHDPAAGVAAQVAPPEPEPSETAAPSPSESPAPSETPAP
jgi:hypothetical protein